MIYDAIIIGGGASGLTAAIALLRRGKKILVLEKEARIGKKILATGNGKCNLMGTLEVKEQYNNSFAEKVLTVADAKKISSFFESLGVLLTEKEGRIYPYSMQASTVLNALRDELSKLNAVVRTENEVVEIQEEREGVFTIKTDKGAEYRTKNVVLATGSSASFGSDSEYLFQKFGHTIREKKPSLVPLITETEFIKGLKGVRADVKASLLIDKREEAQTEDEVLFKDNGLSGTAIFTLSTYLARKEKFRECEVVLDFMPEFSEKRLEDELRERAQKGFSLSGIFHKEIYNNLEKRAGEPFGKKSYSKYALIIKNYSISVKSLSSYLLAQVMSGGLSVSEFEPATLQSKLKKGLFALGEALDVDGACGGYNLMFAWASGLVAGDAIK